MTKRKDKRIFISTARALTLMVYRIDAEVSYTHDNISALRPLLDMLYVYGDYPKQVNRVNKHKTNIDLLSCCMVLSKLVSVDVNMASRDRIAAVLLDIGACIDRLEQATKSSSGR